MNIDKERDAFEAKHPIPKGIAWIDGRYQLIDDIQPLWLDVYLSKWEAWKSSAALNGKKAGPDYWTYIVNGQHRAFSPIEPPDDAYDEGTLEPLYAAQVNEQDAKDAILGRVAMRFVDRAGDVHPGIDDAEKICADFYAAMCEAVDAIAQQGKE